jgi:hypothetical protein
METGKVVVVPCALLRGGFPSERVFVIRFEGGTELRGVAPVQYCYTRDREPIGGGPTADGEVDGFVVGVVIGEKDGIFRVHLPDGDIYELGGDHIESMRAEDARYVSIKS